MKKGETLVEVRIGKSASKETKCNMYMPTYIICMVMLWTFNLELLPIV